MKEIKMIRLWQAGGAIALLIIIMMMLSMRVWRIEDAPESVNVIEFGRYDAKWDCMGTPPNPDPPDGTFGDWN